MMRIACPNCAAVYDVPDQALAGPPRLLRCARCQHQWTPAPLPPASAVQDAPRPEAGPRPASPTPAAAAAPAAVMEIPPSPSAPPAWLEFGQPRAEESRPSRARSAGASLFAAPARGSPLFGASPPSATRRTGIRSLGAVAGIAGWVLTVAILTAAVAGLLLRQPQIEAVWPPSQRLYALLGMHR